MKAKDVAKVGVFGALVYAALALFRQEADAGTSIPGTSLRGAPMPGRKPSILTYPTNRPLTEEEVFQLANYMTTHYGVHIDQWDLMTTAWIESSYRPWAERYEPGLDDYSVGLMQVLTGTALDLYNKGYTAMGFPTRESMKNPAISMYFGASYFDWLKRSYKDRSREWYVRAYNGGPGHSNNAMTTNYYNKWIARRGKYGSGITIRTGVGVS